MKFSVRAKRLTLVLGFACLLLAATAALINKAPPDSAATQNAPTGSPVSSSSGDSQYAPIPPSGSAEIVSIQRGGGYAFIEVELPGKAISMLATAALPPELAVGDTLQWENAHLARNYHSHALNHTFPFLYMVSINEVSPAAADTGSGVVTAVQERGSLLQVDVDAAEKPMRLIVEKRKVEGEITPGSRVEWRLHEDRHPEEAPDMHRRGDRAQVIEIEWLSVVTSR